MNYTFLLVGSWVCHNFLKGRKVTIRCSYRSTCFVLPYSLSSLNEVLPWEEDVVLRAGAEGAADLVHVPGDV